ncbi:MAG: PAS domain S-box protein [Candidatus Hydrogenedentes bacterium]|nr:PAS domain S-box protein [Candidatus Hydrogenedentota bacterium]
MSRHLFVEQEKRQGLGIARTTAIAVQPVMSGDLAVQDSRDYLQHIVEQISRSNAISEMVLLDSLGNVLAKSEPGAKVLPLSNADIARTIETGTPIPRENPWDGSISVYHSVYPAGSGGGGGDSQVSGVLYFTTDLKPGLAHLRLAAFQRAFLSLGLYLASLLVVYWILHRTVIMPARILALQAARLGTGDLAARSGLERATPDGDELQRLAHSFDMMAGEIERNQADREHAQEELRRAESRFRGIFEKAIEGIYQAYADGAFFNVNPALARLLGFASPKDLIESDIAECKHRYADLQRWEDFKRELERKGSVIGFEYQARRADGSQITVSENATAMRDEQGRIRLIEGTVVDVTDRLRIEQALRSSEARFRALIENGSDLIAIVDYEGIISYASPALTRELGYPREKLIGAAAIEFVHMEDRALAEAKFREVRQSPGRMLRYEERFLHSDGTWRDLDVIGYNMLEEPGVRGIVYTARDITAQRRSERERLTLEAKVQQTQKLESLGILAGGIAHDFNNLLTGILGHADLALVDLSPVSPVREHLNQIVTASRRAAELAKQMLAYSGRGSLVVQPIQLTEVVQEMSHLLEVSISKKCLLNYRFADNLPLIKGDITQIRQIVMNLIINASEAIGNASGVIAIGTGLKECSREYLADSCLDENLPAGPYVFLEVIDTGSGMSEEVLSRLFDPFFTTKFTGRGLGMAAVLGIVRGHKGAIKVESKVGQGTTVRVLFPATQLAISKDTHREEGARSWRGKGKILITDDEETIRTLAKMMLEKIGFEVLTAADGREGVEVFRAHAHELSAVLLDMTMPHLDGEGAFIEMQKIRPEVPVILSSGFSEQEASSRFTSAGLAGFIQKPYSLEELVNCIRRTLEG